MVGGVLLLAALFKLGFLADFISAPVHHVHQVVREERDEAAHQQVDGEEDRQWLASLGVRGRLGTQNAES